LVGWWWLNGEEEMNNVSGMIRMMQIKNYTKQSRNPPLSHISRNAVQPRIHTRPVSQKSKAYEAKKKKIKNKKINKLERERERERDEGNKRK
jgi:hypothetical protein